MAYKKLSAGLVALVSTLAIITTPVQAVPPSEELAQPEIVFSENFESGKTPIRLTDYQSGKYTADPQWLNIGYANGIVLGGEDKQWIENFLDTDKLPAWRRYGHFGSDQVVDPATQQAWENSVNTFTKPEVWTSMMAVATAAGDFHDSSGSANHSLVLLSTLVSGMDEPMSAGKSIFETAAPIITDSGFYTFSMEGAAVACDYPEWQPKLSVMLVEEDGKTTTLGDFNPCRGENLTVTERSYFKVSDGKYGVRNVWASAMKPVAPLKIANNQKLKLRIVNNTDQPYGDGNDFGIDNLELKSLTPHITRSFQPASSTVFDFSEKTVSYTITNTTDLLAKDGWSFTDKLPDGLQLSPSASENTCGANISMTEDGALTVSGSLVDQQKSCRITLSMTADLGGADSRVFDSKPITVVERLRDDTSPLAFGVYKDDDRDNVPNTKDLCPKTAYTHEVDDDGCSIEQINTPSYEPITVIRGSQATVEKPLFDNPITDVREAKSAPAKTSYLIGAKAPNWASINLDGSISVKPGFQVIPGDYWVPVTVNYSNGASTTTQAKVSVLDLPKPAWDDASTDPATSVRVPNVGEHPAGMIGSYLVDGPGDLTISADGTVIVTPKAGCQIADKVKVSVWLRDGSLADTFTVTITEPKKVGSARVTPIRRSVSVNLPDLGSVKNPGLIVDGPATASLSGNSLIVTLRPETRAGQLITVFITNDKGQVVAQITVDVVADQKPSGLPKTGR